MTHVEQQTTTGSAKGWTTQNSFLSDEYEWTAFVPGASRNGKAKDKATAAREAQDALAALERGER